MKPLLKPILAGAMLAALPAMAQTADVPIITIHTDIYNVSGAENDFVIYMGMTEDDYIDIDGGFGLVECPVSQATFDTETQSISATQVATRVSEAGVVKIYGDPSKIDYLDMGGTYITSVEMSQLTNLEILSMEHNYLEALDLTPFTKLQSIVLSDNPFDVSPLVVGGNKPDLTILTLDIIGDMSQDFNLSDYPSLQSFSAWNNKGLHQLDPTGCPLLLRISIDATDVASLDVSQNTKLQILNISDTRIRSIDLTNCPNLGEFYAQHMSGTVNTDVKLTSIDLSNNPLIYYLYLSGNKLTELDVTCLPNLMMFGADHNLLTGIDLSANDYLYDVNISGNYMDFATLPINPGTWGNYVCEQEPLPVGLSYPVGATIDLSDRVLRQNYTTTATMYLQDSYNPNSLSELDPSYYSYDDGKITLLKAVTDSVYVSFYNDAFDDCTLSTSKFMVKSEAAYGQPTTMVKFTSIASPSTTIELYVGLAGASADSPKTIYIDGGDGTPTPYTITESAMPAEPNVSMAVTAYGNKLLQTDDGVYLTAFGCHSPLTSLDCSAASSLLDLDLDGAGLYSIDLTKNNRLQRLDLSNNNLYSLNLAGTNGGTSKINLNYIRLAHNYLSEFEVPDNRTLVNLDLSYNKISSLSFRDADNLTDLNIAGNSFTELDLTYCTGLNSLNAADNSLTTVTLAEGVTPTALDLSGNCFTFASLPHASLFPECAYTYAPQQPIGIPTIGPGINLSDQCVDIDGHTTVFEWLKADGSAVTEGTDYTISDGRTRFVNTEMGKVYCKVTNGGMPELELTTTQIEAAGMPTNLLAEFTTPVGGQTADLSLAATTGNPALYIDWTGCDDLEQYQLKDTYTLFTATTTEGARVKVYTYRPEELISVFSVSGVTMADADFSRMTDLTTLTLSGSGLTSLQLPESELLRELVLEGNQLSAIDLSRYTRLWSLSLANNNFTTYDLSPFANLQVASLAGNDLTDITLDNSKLWLLDLSQNQLDHIDLSGVPNMEQLSLAFNNFTTIDVSALNKIVLLMLDGNKFNYSTLPLPKASYIQYVYSNQADLQPQVTDNAVVDLSYNAQAADGSVTEYRWFIGKPDIDDNGELDGEELYIDDEYSLEDGVTTFMGTFTDLVCVMTNPAFSGMYMYTTPIAVQGAGLNTVKVSEISVKATAGTVTVSAPEGTVTALYDIRGTSYGSKAAVGGQAVYTGLQPGIYLLATPAGTWKLRL